MAKKIKSFNVDEETYKEFAGMLKEYESELSISYFVDKCLKELFTYFKTLETELKDEEKKKEIMSLIIERTARRTLIGTPSKDVPGESERGSNSRLLTTALEPQISFATFEQQYEGETFDMGEGEPWEVSVSELDEAVRYWQDELEAQKRCLSLAFVRYLRTGEFVLSADKKYLIHKETGKKYVDFFQNYIIQVVTPNSGKRE